MKVINLPCEVETGIMFTLEEMKDVQVSAYYCSHQVPVEEGVRAEHQQTQEIEQAIILTCT